MNEDVTDRSTEGARRKPSPAKAWLKAIELTARIEAEPRRLFADVVEDWSKRQSERLALLSDGENFTYGALAARINQFARWARRQGIGRGQTVCLIMPNRPNYLACWLGISRVGGVVALINTKLIGQSLAHCIDVARPSHIIVAHDVAEAFASAAQHLLPRSTTARSRKPSTPTSPSTIARC